MVPFHEPESGGPGGPGESGIVPFHEPRSRGLWIGLWSAWRRVRWAGRPERPGWFWKVLERWPGGPGGSGGLGGGPGDPEGPGGDPGDDPDDGGNGGGWSYSTRDSTRSFYDRIASRKDELAACKEALKAVGTTVDKYATEVEGSKHVFGPLLRLAWQVWEVRGLEPVRRAREMVRCGSSVVGEEIGETVLTDHSLLSEVAQHCFGSLSSEYRELSTILAEARVHKNLTLA
ncbi:hypothetical protein CYMTET_9657 [Cymbomonas tetramitiformis]|uniref:Uncharacterized protein n=1 Tax=Cymbomonas tetramitiformis TaxID=36881 RepID=A0AAE0GR88_9CHLO|nr:hypothetical protein CYMTET_9657 [Cymbomonas tetramitiformis]